ncbi:MAG: 3-deoxy-7-phosphoheptulonate synthase [Zetaproteobacteria bacterium]|nr:3-deoxy-7-phosphoheptulonate synthase [Pseudobdellovibrionaceae bacterium]
MKHLKLTLRRNKDHQSVVRTAEGQAIGGEQFVFIGGPCAIEDEEMIRHSAGFLGRTKVSLLRGGAFKPRTSPYSFQGLGEDGLRYIRSAADQYQLGVVTEVMAIEQVPLVEKYASILQIGSRNMQNFDLLKVLGKSEKPVLLKRGLAATLEEFLGAAEYLMAYGNPNVILCERGIRSYDPYTRNVLDLAAVVALKQLTHLPVIVDPSHAAGKSELIDGLAKAAVAAGADGLMIECHPRPQESVSDARQALSLNAMADLVKSVEPILGVMGRQL